MYVYIYICIYMCIYIYIYIYIRQSNEKIKIFWRVAFFSNLPILSYIVYKTKL